MLRRKNTISNDSLFFGFLFTTLNIATHKLLQKGLSFLQTHLVIAVVIAQNKSELYPSATIACALTLSILAI
jgi:hypothetical protein